ncbi:hypothetical protein WJX81_004189 [Elliptochloris bilobata]|uniref:Enoyl-CoA hydratase n=1 Tax=Elliptochloris bilobata TaxID=381761 RepID=A0AAW1RCN8_9CHLO
MWAELPQALEALDAHPDVRAVLLTGQGKNFCAGIDFSALAGVVRVLDAGCPGRARERLLRDIQRWQASLTALERCRWPVIAAIDGACIGAGVDMITACDIRYCTESAYFCVKEVDLAITADMGTLQRLPGIVGDGAARELALTARRLGASEALALRLVSAVHPDAVALRIAAARTAAAIAARSPLAVAGTKRVLLHSRDHTVADGLEFVAAYNSALLPSADLQEVFRAVSAREQPRFAKL